MNNHLTNRALLLPLALLCYQVDFTTAQPPESLVQPPAYLANPPEYLMLQAPAVTAPDSRHPGPGYYPGVGRSVSTQAYAYGWYGATPRKRWSRQFGYYRNYTQWSRR